MATRREELAEAATDYPVEHGLIGLSPPPLGEALGTSDRMLLHHFRDKDDLVADASLSASVGPPRAGSGRSRPRATCARQTLAGQLLESAGRLPAPLRRGGLPRDLRPRALRDRGPRGQRDLDASARGPSRRRWDSARGRKQVANLVDAAFMGLQLDQPRTPRPSSWGMVGDLADAVAARWGSRGPLAVMSREVVQTGAGEPG